MKIVRENEIETLEDLEMYDVYISQKGKARGGDNKDLWMATMNDPRGNGDYISCLETSEQEAIDAVQREYEEGYIREFGDDE